MCVYVMVVLYLSFSPRGENGPCGYKVVPIRDGNALFIWVLNTDLKVSCVFVCMCTCI